MEKQKTSAQIEREMVASDLLSGKEMSDFEKQYVFNAATRYTSSLVKKNSEGIYGYEIKSDAVKKHLDVVVLDRIISLRPTGSTTEQFTALKHGVCNSLGIMHPESLTDERLQAILMGELDSYFDEELVPDVSVNMDFIKSATDRIIPS